jgi:hypothetical protein
MRFEDARNGVIQTVLPAFSPRDVAVVSVKCKRQSLQRGQLTGSSQFVDKKEKKIERRVQKIKPVPIFVGYSYLLR